MMTNPPAKKTTGRDERGSVLVFVVGVLVLLALAATAYLSTARVDRQTTKQNEFTTQVDLLLEALRQASVAVISVDPTASFDPATMQFADFAADSSGGTDAWLAARAPTTVNPAFVYDASTGNFAIWRSLSGPVLGATFEAPDGTTRVGTARYLLSPTATLFGGALRPAMLYDSDPSTAGFQTNDPPLLAGDADGDGIADSLYFKLPVGKLGGLEYFACVRIIDNNSAVNVNTAQARAVDFDGVGAATYRYEPATMSDQYINYNFFTANIGLAELLYTYTQPDLQDATRDIDQFGIEFINLNNWRFRNAYPDGVFSTTAGTFNAPTRDDGTPGDFLWFTLGDVVQHQISRRLDNVGYVRAGTYPQPFSRSDASALASRYILKDSTGAQSDIETVFSQSLFTHASLRGTPYTADQVDLWYTQNFNFVNETPADGTTFMPRRVLLTAWADTSNLAVKDTVPTGAGMTDTLASGTPKASINTSDFADLFRSYYQVLSRHGLTAGTNTDPYEGLKFNAVSQASDGTREDTSRMFKSPIRSVPTSEGAYTPPYDGNAPTATYTDKLSLPIDQVVLLRAAIAAVNHETLRLQNSPKESTAPNYATGVTTPDVARYRDITLTVNGLPAPGTATARIYGFQRQPFITEVFTSNDDVNGYPYTGSGTVNPRGYIAIELYNPYDVAIDIRNCRFGLIHRLRRTSLASTTPGANPFPQMRLEDGSALTTEPVALNAAGVKSNLDYEPPTGGFSSPTIIPPRGYLVLENYDADDPSPDATAARYRPGAIAAGATGFAQTGPAALTVAAGAPPRNVAYVPNLHQLLNREFVLMRPLDAEIATETVNTGLADPTADLLWPTLRYLLETGVTTPNLVENFAPMDSYDLSGQAPLLNSTESSQIFNAAFVRHYQRDTRQWRFVYPGRYDAAQAAMIGAAFIPYPTQQGTQQSEPWFPKNNPIPPNAPDPLEHDTTDPNINYGQPAPPSPLAPLPSLGANNDFARQQQFFSIQLSNEDWPGMNPLMAGHYRLENSSGTTVSQMHTQPITGRIYPFGRFGRLGDLTQVPFIGSYTIYIPASGTTPTIDSGSPVIIECNPITMDAAMAEDTDIETDPKDPAGAGNDPQHAREQIGRFVPLRAMYAGDQSADQNPTGNLLYDDYAQASTNPQPANDPLWRYRFARYLFEFFTLESPATDFMPNVGYSTVDNDNAYKYATSTGSPPTYVKGNEPEAVSNSGITPANGTREATEPVRGLININTAPRKVLAAIPWVPEMLDVNDTNSPRRYYDMLYFNPGNGQLVVNAAGTHRGDNAQSQTNDNEDVAAAIEYWRNNQTSVPFNTIYDIYRCPAVRGLQLALLQFGDPGPIEGDLSPFYFGRDGVRYDFEEQTLVLNRVSNLITTRSDTYTVYILLQGWRNAGSAAAELVVERRAGMMVDRSSYTPSNGNVSAVRVPTN